MEGCGTCVPLRGTAQGAFRMTWAGRSLCGPRERWCRVAGCRPYRQARGQNRIPGGSTVLCPWRPSRSRCVPVEPRSASRRLLLMRRNVLEMRSRSCGVPQCPRHRSRKRCRRRAQKVVSGCPGGHSWRKRGRHARSGRASRRVGSRALGRLQHCFRRATPRDRQVAVAKRSMLSSTQLRR